MDDPIALPAGDQRFTMGLLFDVTRVLVNHGYPEPTGTELADLQCTLWAFLHHRGGDVEVSA